MTVNPIIPCVCRCRTCPDCGPYQGWLIRQNLLAKADLFTDPHLLTLTIDRSRFASPEAAHDRITEGGFIRRLMRLLGIKKWFWVLEFQTQSGEGWPHWHFLVDLSDVGGFLDLKRAWKLWRDRWKLGGLDLQCRITAENREHAVFYVTKYLTKTPEAVPPWVLLRARALRFLGASKAIGSLTGKLPAAPAEPLDPGEQMNLPFRSARTVLLYRMARCKMKATVFHFSGDIETGQGEWKWAGTIAAPVEDIIELAETGLISARVAAIGMGEDDRETVVMTDASIGGVVHALRVAAAELSDRDVGHTSAWVQRALEREWEIFEHHAAFWQRLRPGEA
ncbi:MAG TPA: hypothetical protein VGR35_08110 [Tepidisphaeraceae bacterium]|nr:hypothetical protein [Tepidisphaeraceae bacterium]